MFCPALASNVAHKNYELSETRVIQNVDRNKKGVFKDTGETAGEEIGA